LARVMAVQGIGCAVREAAAERHRHHIHTHTALDGLDRARVARLGTLLRRSGLSGGGLGGGGLGGGGLGGGGLGFFLVGGGG